MQALISEEALAIKEYDATGDPARLDAVQRRMPSSAECAWPLAKFEDLRHTCTHAMATNLRRVSSRRA